MAESSRSNQVTEASSDEPVTFIMRRNMITYTCLMCCIEEENDYQSCSYYLSAIVAMFPELEETATNVMSRLGCQLKKIDPAIFVNTGTVLTILGQAIFILYKYFPNDVSYMQFMQKRANALKSVVGLGGTSSEVIFTFAKARALQKNLQKFKANLLRTMLGHQNDGDYIGRMCYYICKILCWADMSTYRFIHENLCKTRSPVLEDVMISEEAKNLEIACTAINNTEYPQYFRILYPYEVTKVMDISRFPTIAAVAQTLRSEIEVYSLPRITHNNSVLVERLVAAHSAYMDKYTKTDPEFLKILEELYENAAALLRLM